MKAMFRAAILPLVTAETAGSCARTARLLCFGTSEARIGESIADLMVRGRNPLVGTTASEGVISVRIQAVGTDQADAQKLIDADVTTVRERLGDIVFGEDKDSLEAVVGRLLTMRLRTIATAESCTGGLLAKRLTDVPGSSTYFVRGLVAYSNEAKTDLLAVPAPLIETEGAVSDAVARAMAVGCRKAAGSDYAIGITGIAGPTGGSPPEKPVGLVYVALADTARVDSKRLLLGEHLTRAEIRDRSCKVALNLLRLDLLDVPG
jgi:nicotinamide-nucleotide amidase